jgi:hypothetical protein
VTFGTQCQNWEELYTELCKSFDGGKGQSWDLDVDNGM